VSGMLHLEEAAPTDLHGLEQLEYLGGDLYLGGQLTSLEGLRSLGAIGGKLTIASPKLPDLSDLSENWQAGALVLSGADALTDLHGVTKPDVEELSIVACHRLTSLDGIEGGSFPDGLRLENNPLLEDLGALAGYTTLGGLTIHGNQSLPNLNGLEGLTSLSGDLSISGRCEQFCTDGDDDGEDVCVERCEQNAALTSLRALAGLGWVGGNLEIFGNPSLPACEAEWLLGSIGASNVRSTITIAHNDGIGVCP